MIEEITLKLDLKTAQEIKSAIAFRANFIVRDIDNQVTFQLKQQAENNEDEKDNHSAGDPSGDSE